MCRTTTTIISRKKNTFLIWKWEFQAERKKKEIENNEIAIADIVATAFFSLYLNLSFDFDHLIGAIRIR